MTRPAFPHNAAIGRQTILMKREHILFPSHLAKEADMLTLLRLAASFSSRKKDTCKRFFITLLDERKTTH